MADEMDIEEPIFERAQTTYKTDPSFVIETQSYASQYVNTYFLRLATLKRFLVHEGKMKWGDREINGDRIKRVNRVLDVRQGEITWVIGTIYMEMPLKPNVLEDIAKDHFLTAPPTRQKYRDYDKDKIMLEDESGRIGLIGPMITKERLVTGCIVGVCGTETSSGEFEVIDVIYPEMPPQKPLPELSAEASGKKKYIGLVSGLNITGEGGGGTPLLMLTNFLLGTSGGPQMREKSSRISRLIIAGNSLAVSGSALTEGLNRKTARKFGADARAFNVKPTTALDQFLRQLGTSIPVTVMPGDTDPANASIPQQKMHPTMFPKAKRMTGSGFIPATNPHIAEIDGVRFLGTSGQPLNDIYKYLDGDDRIEMMERTLKWRHIAPTAPDTLWCYPFKDEDPFVINECPHVYFAGNQPKYQSELIYGDGEQDERGNMRDQTVRVILVPKFSQTGQLVLVDLETLETETVTFGVRRKK